MAEQEACKEDSRTVAVFGQYTFIPLRDSPSPLGTQITPIVPTLERSALLAACDADTTCIAVNTNGYLKDEVEPQPTSTYPEQWITGACGGIYIKTSEWWVWWMGHALPWFMVGFSCGKGRQRVAVYIQHVGHPYHVWGFMFKCACAGHSGSDTTNNRAGVC